MWRAWHEADSIPANVRLAISAGAPLPLALEQEAFATRGLKLHNFYGATECGGIAYDASEAPRSDDACIGAPMRNVNLSVGEDGCLVVQSRAAGQTYWPEPTEALGGGRFQTSDLVELRDDLVLLRGRASDLINVAGRKVSPETIEQALRGHPRVRECLVFGAPSQDASRTETIVTVVAAEAEDETELKNFLQQKIPAWQLPREWRFVESLNANERGKISRAEWRRRYMEKS
jgi:acyl-coenzyme A synthetase/AMP-(fatty) acid ligase